MTIHTFGCYDLAMIHPPTHQPNIHYTRCPSFYPSALFLWRSMLIRRPVSSARISSTVNIQSSSFFYYYYYCKRRQASPPVHQSLSRMLLCLSVCLSLPACLAILPAPTYTLQTCMKILSSLFPIRRSGAQQLNHSAHIRSDHILPLCLLLSRIPILISTMPMMNVF